MKLPRGIRSAALATLLLSASPLVAQTDYSALQILRQIQYQGRVATGTGGAWSGTEGYFAFALVQGPTVLWNNWEGTASPSDPGTVTLGAGQVLTLPVSGGVFSIRLGEGSDTNKQVPATVFFDAISNAVRSGVQLAVWFSPDGGTFTRLNPDVSFTSVPYAMVSGIAESVKERAVTQNMLASTAAVPVGGIIAWWGAKSAIPSGFEICDGIAPTTPGALVAVKPDLRGKFPRGAENARTDVAASPFGGGADVIDTRTSGGTAITPAQMPSHGHAITVTVNSAGAHSHTFPIGPGDAGARDKAADGDQAASNNPSTSSVPSHSHSASATASLTGSGVAHTHPIPAHDNRPAYLELFYIIRVK